MICHLRTRILSRLLQSPCPCHAPVSRIPPLFSSQHLLSTTASPISPKPFAVEEYLFATCNLTRAQALKASKKLSHLKSPRKPDAVLAFLSDLGVARSGITALVASDPQVLCASVEKTLAPRITELGDLGLSRAKIAQLVPLAPCTFRISSLSRRVSFWLSAFNGSFELLRRAQSLNSAILGCSIEKVAIPNLAFMKQCGISASDVPFMNIFAPRLFTFKPKSLHEAAERVEELGIKLGSRMFRHAFALVAFMRKEDCASKIGLLQKIGFSQDDVSVILRKAPLVLRLSEERIRQAMHFLTRDAGLDAPYIAQRPALFMYSLERRLLPRYFLLKVLREKGLLNFEYSFYYTAALAEKMFVYASI
ncbi:hypothetical protein EJB05_45615, partial [Eragrostis curvula]